MKKIAITILVLFVCPHLFAQTDSLPYYQQHPGIPAFTLSKTPDSTVFTKADIQKGKPLVFILFSPDCEHCQRETDSLIAHIDLFKHAQIVMASPLDYSIIKRFYLQYKIADYPNIIMGKDIVWALGTFYQTRSFPAIIVYDKNGQFVKRMEGNIPVQRIASLLR